MRIVSEFIRPVGCPTVERWEDVSPIMDRSQLGVNVRERFEL